jgi:tRNA(Ile)-lysidine synthase
VPGARLREFAAQARSAGPDARVECAWEDWRLRAWDGRLWLSRAATWRALETVPWDTVTPLRLAGPGGLLSLVDTGGTPSLDLVVRARRPGDRIRAAGAPHHRRVKDLLREWRIPPWMRASVPIIERSGETLAVADRVVHERLAESLHGAGARLHWSPADPALAWAWAAARPAAG